MRFAKCRNWSDRGAAMVEAALVLPFVILLTFGVIDGGLYFAARSSVGNAARDGARAASIHGTSGTADFEVLKAAQRSVSGIVTGGVTRVVVFKADDYDLEFPNACRNGNSNPGQRCNVYTPADFSRPASDFSTPTWNGPKGWVTSERVTSRSLGTDLVGVAVTSKMITPFGVFGSKDRTITRIVIIQMEATEI